MTGADIVAAARAQLGVPWVHQGRMAGHALDCAGLVIVIGRHLGAWPSTFDVNGYSRSPDGTMLAVCDEHLERINDLELGAVLVLATEKEPQHIGIVGNYVHGGWSIIHSTNAGPRKVVETRLMFTRNMQRRGVFRIPGVV